MPLPNWLRVLPALAVFELLGLAATAPRPSTIGVAPPSQFYPPCDVFAFAGSGDSVIAFPADAGITQPLPPGIAAVSCSLQVLATGYSFARVLLRQWDPATLAPDLQTVALRTQWLDPSSMVYSGNRAPRVTFVPPVVTRSLAGVADPPRLTTAFEIISRFSADFLASFDPAGDSRMPPASVLHADGTRAPLPGAHPVYAHAVCTGDDDLKQLRIAQSVMRADTLPLSAVAAYAQRFRVPEAVELRWIELAMNTGNYPIYPTRPDTAVAPPRMPLLYPIVGIIDGGEMAAPGATMPATLVEAAVNIYVGADRPIWVSNVALDNTVRLQPGHDYWLYVRDAGAGTLRFQLARLTGGESADFRAGIGPYFERDATSGEWQVQPDRALSFRLIGKPLPAVPAPPPGQRGDLRLRVAPNPSLGIITADWSGAVGPVRLEVFDARGRRVATGAGGAAGAGQFARTDRGGQALPAGVYFVHARDTAGGHVVQRVVLLR